MAYLNLVCCQLIRSFYAMDVFQLAIFVCAKRKPIFASIYDRFVYRIGFLACSDFRVYTFQYFLWWNKCLTHC